MEFDPKLVELREKITRLIEEYDAGGTVSLISKTHGEFSYVIPDWTAITELFDKEGRGIGMRIQTQGVATDFKEKEKLNLTGHFIFSQRECSCRFARLFIDLCKALEEQVKVDFKFEVHPHGSGRVN